MMRAFGLQAIVLVLILVSAAPAWAKSTNIVIDGAEGKNAKNLRALVEDAVQDPFNLNQLEKAMSLIYATGLYNDVEVYFDEKGEKTDVIFKVFPLRIIRSIKFTGNGSFSGADLLAELQVNENEGYSAEKVKNGIENIKKYYNLNGYLNASVSGEFNKIEGTSDVALNVVIDEGPPCLVEEINFKSVNNALNKQLQSHFKDRKKKLFTQAALNKLQSDINDYMFENKYYSSTVLPPETVLNPLKTGVTINYVINDPYVFSIIFEGNNEMRDVEIQRKLNLDPNNRLSNSPIEDLMERILRVYKKAGYADVSVKYRENLYTQEFERRINFIIHEGPRVKIKDVVFEGNFSRPPKYYKNFLLDHSGDLVSSGYYNSDDIDSGIKNLLIDLQNQGFIGAKVTGTRTDFDKHRETALIKVTLDEGPQTFVDKIVYKGVKSISKDEIESTIGLQAGSPLHLSALEDASSRIVSLYQSKGFLDAQVANQGKSIIQYSNDNTRATLTFEIIEGPQVIVSQVVIEGNGFTKDYVIRRELQFKPGDVLTPEKISYSEQRLQRLSFFSAVDIHTLEEDPNQGHRTVLVRVTERPPGVFKGGGGVNNELLLTLKLFAGVAYRNIGGTGRGINARAEIADKVYYGQFLENEVNLGYTEPFIFNTQNTGRLNLLESTKIYQIDNINNFVLAVNTWQGDIVLERDLSQRLKLIYEVYGIAREFTFEIYGNPAFNNSLINIATTGPTLLYDRRDDPFNPTRGDLSTLSFEYSNPYMGSTQTVNYYKTVAGYTRYIPMGRVVFANEFKGGYIKNLSPLFDGAIPFIKAFFLGGPSTIRGFDPAKESIPLITDLDRQAPPLGTATYTGLSTESYFLLAKSELRFPIYGNFGGALFYDGGRVGFPGYSPKFVWRDSLGIGLRYITPVGPVSVEWAQKLEVDDSRNEGPGAFIFSIGVF